MTDIHKCLLIDAEKAKLKEFMFGLSTELAKKTRTETTEAIALFITNEGSKFCHDYIAALALARLIRETF